MAIFFDAFGHLVLFSLLEESQGDAMLLRAYPCVNGLRCPKFSEYQDKNHMIGHFYGTVVQ
jgi:hypothetical protein